MAFLWTLDGRIAVVTRAHAVDHSRFFAPSRWPDVGGWSTAITAAAVHRGPYCPSNRLLRGGRGDEGETAGAEEGYVVPGRGERRPGERFSLTIVDESKSGRVGRLASRLL